MQPLEGHTTLSDSPSSLQREDSNSNIDSVLLALLAPSPPSSPSRDHTPPPFHGDDAIPLPSTPNCSFSDRNTVNTPSASSQYCTAPKSSSKITQEHFDKVKSTICKVAPKRTFETELLEIS